MKGLLLHIKPCLMLVSLRDGSQEWYISKLAKASGATYVYTDRVLKRFEKDGLLLFENKGRKKIAKLSEKGALVAAALEELMKKLEQPKAAPQTAPAQASAPPPADRAT